MAATIEEQRRRLAEVPKDFEVQYRFYSSDEGGRKTGPPYQGYRCDWLYDGYPVEKGIYMVWPVFLDETGSILDTGAPVADDGTAQMLIVNDELRVSLHAKRLKPGVRGYFMEGPRRVAEATVTRLLAMSDVVPAGTDR
jgi:hypothetical protein